MVTFYANIRIKGGSRPLFLRPMGERGSAPEPSVIRIFAYPGYKGAYTGGFSLLLLAARLVKSRRGSRSLSKSSSFLQVKLPSRSSHVGELCLCRFFVPTRLSSSFLRVKSQSARALGAGFVSVSQSTGSSGSTWNSESSWTGSSWTWNSEELGAEVAGGGLDGAQGGRDSFSFSLGFLCK